MNKYIYLRTRITYQLNSHLLPSLYINTYHQRKQEVTMFKGEWQKRKGKNDSEASNGQYLNIAPQMIHSRSFYPA